MITFNIIIVVRIMLIAYLFLNGSFTLNHYL